jgi:diadenosine tetraphosphate (Ap4A) HIT family hydrolase
VTCGLCRHDLGPVLRESEHWRLVLNRNQNLLGKSLLALRRHCESVAELTGEEWVALQGELAAAGDLLSAALSPDQFNYALLQNVDRHVHVHVIPRYASPREFGGRTFVDEDFPGPQPMRGWATTSLVLDSEELAALARLLV